MLNLPSKTPWLVTVTRTAARCKATDCRRAHWAASRAETGSASAKRPGGAGFTLVEMLAVMGIIVVLLGLLIPVITSIQGGRDVTRAAYDISGLLENARTYAVANNTYVWVGFYEEDGSQASTTPATAGTGRVVISVVASKDGTRYSDAEIDATTPPAFGVEAPTASPLRNQVKLTPLLNLVKLDGIHLAATNNGPPPAYGTAPAEDTNPPVRPAVQPAYQVGDATSPTPANFASHLGTDGSSVTNPTTFTYPITVYGSPHATQYTFVKIIEFNPQGEASKMEENTFSGQGPQTEMEVALQPAHGSMVDPAYSGNNSTNAAVAIQIEGLSGQVRIYRP